VEGWKRESRIQGLDETVAKGKRYKRGYETIVPAIEREKRHIHYRLETQKKRPTCNLLMTHHFVHLEYRKGMDNV
jgi:hypothetical protein